jgi:sulfotransferase
MIHFIAGLPRSGSTLLSALLRQNPRFSASITSPLYGIICSLREATAAKVEGSPFLTNERKAAMLCAVAGAYYYPSSDLVNFDTNRSWASAMALIAELWPQAKVVCPVRSIADILESFEGLHQRSPLDVSGIYQFSATTTVYDRTTALAASTGSVGGALDCLREAYYGPHRDRLLLVNYGEMLANPREQLGRVYEHIGEPMIEHDLENIELRDPAIVRFDEALGVPKLHRVRQTISRRQSCGYLPPDLRARYANDDFWLR